MSRSHFRRVGVQQLHKCANSICTAITSNQGFACPNRPNESIDWWHHQQPLARHHRVMDLGIGFVLLLHVDTHTGRGTSSWHRMRRISVLCAPHCPRLGPVSNVNPPSPQEWIFSWVAFAWIQGKKNIRPHLILGRAKWAWTSSSQSNVNLFPGHLVVDFPILQKSNGQMTIPRLVKKDI